MKQHKKMLNILINEASGKYAAQIQNRVNQTIVIAKTLALKFEEALNTNAKIDEKETIAYLKSLSKYNEDILGFWFKTKDKELLFESNPELKGQNGYDKNGQYLRSCLCFYNRQLRDGIRASK
jgi:hypothetical protein